MQSVPNVNDREDFDEVREAMEIVGIEEAEQKQIYKLWVGILTLGNIACQDRGIKKDDPNLNSVADLLQLKAPNLIKWLNKRKITAGKDVMMKP
eukprot:Pgem_evm1s14035